MSTWQDRLAEAMQARGITGGELARRTGFSPQYINSMRSGERGERLPLDTAKRLAAALGVTVEWLTGTERLSDSFPTLQSIEMPPPDSGAMSERYPSRATFIALLGPDYPPEVIAALRQEVPADPAVDPGHDYWYEQARIFMVLWRRIREDPEMRPPPSPMGSSPGRSPAPMGSGAGKAPSPMGSGSYGKPPGSGPSGPASPRRKAK